jgi:hypothetical protein
LRKIFGLSIATAVAALVISFFYGLISRGTMAYGFIMLWLCLVVGILEISMSFDNAVVNVIILSRMNETWQRRFLTWGVPIATFGMRFTLPIGVVWIASGLAPWQALPRAFSPPANHAAFYPDGTPSYETALGIAGPLILGFGSMFLLPLAMKWITEKREVTWLGWAERPMAKAGRMEAIFVVLSLAIFLGITSTLVATHHLAHDKLATVLTAGMIGLGSYLLVTGLETFFNVEEDEDQSTIGAVTRTAAGVATGGLATFAYLEMLDASMSFDGVIGSFAITSDPIIIALGTGLIGSMAVRSITIYLHRHGVLKEFVYLEHGAHWAIGILAIIMMVEIGIKVPDLVTSLVGVVLIGAAFLTSIVKKRRENRFAGEVAELLGSTA